MDTTTLDEILSLREKGMSHRDIAQHTGLPKSTVGYHLTKAEDPYDYESALVIGDYHIPFHDERAIELTLKIGDQLKPDYIIINGDGGDFWEISRWEKSPHLRGRAALPEEIRVHRKFLTDLRKRFPFAKIKYIGGNHDHRMHSYIVQNATALYGLEGLSLPEQLHFAENGIEWIYNHRKEASWMWGKLLIGHFDKVSKHSAYTAKALIEDKGISCMQNHTHRGGVFFKRTYDRTLVGYENFCLCDINPPYLDRPNWQQGFSVIFKDKETDLFHVDQYPIINIDNSYRTMYKGKIFET